MDSSKLWYASSGIWGGVAAAVAGLAGIAGYTITPADQAAMADSIAQTVTLISSLTAVGGGLLAIFGRARASKTIAGSAASTTTAG